MAHHVKGLNVGPIPRNWKPVQKRKLSGAEFYIYLYPRQIWIFHFHKLFQGTFGDIEEFSKIENLSCAPDFMFPVSGRPRYCLVGLKNALKPLHFQNLI